MENEEQVVKQEEKKKRRPFDITVKIYKIISIILYSVWTLFLGYLVISSKMDAASGDSEKALGYVFVIIIVIAIGLIGYGIMTAIGIIGLSMSIANKENPKRKGNIIFFAIESVVSVGTFFALILLISLGA